MFKVKKTTKPGECQAMRCNSPAQDKLCPRHDKEHEQAGRPDLETNTPKPGPAGAGTGMVPAELEGQLTEERHKAQKALEMVQRLPAETEQDRVRLAALINVAGAQIKTLDDRRKSVTGPLLAIKKTVDGWFSPAIDFYEKAQTCMKDKVSARMLQLEAEAAKARVEVLESPQTAPAESFELAQTPVTAPAGLGSRDVWKYKITSFELVPDKYKLIVLDHAKLTREVQDLGSQAVIPGIEVYKEIQLKGTR
jgi:hypothetical protein